MEGEGTALAKETAFFNNIENTFQLGHIAVVECFYVILETLGSIPRIQLMKKQENKGRKGEGRKEEGKTGVDYDIFLHFSYIIKVEIIFFRVGVSFVTIKTTLSILKYHIYLAKSRNAKFILILESCTVLYNCSKN